MTIRVIMLRRVPPEKNEDLRPLLLKMRSLAVRQTGYVSGETLISADDPEEVLVISTWRNMENWNDWLASEERQAVQEEIDNVVGQETLYQVYYCA